MPKKTASPNLAFAVAQLRKNPKTSFAALRAAGQKKGLNIVPIVYGRAKLALGLAKPGPGKAGADKAGDKSRAATAPSAAPITSRGQLRTTPARNPSSNGVPAAAPTPPAAPRRRGRPARSQASVLGTNGALDLNQLAEAVRLANDMRKALQQIQSILDRFDLQVEPQARQAPRRRGRPRKQA